MRVLLTLALLVSSWEPAVAGIIFRAASTRAPAPIVPVIGPIQPIFPQAQEPTAPSTLALPSGIELPPGPVEAASPGEISGAKPVAGKVASAASRDNLSAAAREAGEIARAALSDKPLETLSTQGRRVFEGESAKGIGAPVVVKFPREFSAFALAPHAASAGKDVSFAPRRLPGADEALQKQAKRRLLLGTGIFKVGMEFLAITMPLAALQYFHSAVWLAGFAASWGIGLTAAGMLAGSLVARRPSEKVMAAAMGTQSLLVGAMGLLFLFSGVPNPWAVMALYSLAGAAMGVVLTVRNTLPIRILGKDEAVLKVFNAKVHSVFEVTGTCSMVAAALVIQHFGLMPALLIHPAAYLLAAWVFARLKLKPLETKTAPELPAQSFAGFCKKIIENVKEGARLMMGGSRARWFTFLLAGPFLIHRLAEQMFVPIFASRVLNNAAASPWIVSGSDVGELLGAMILWRMAVLARDKPQKPNPYRWVLPMAAAVLALWVFPSAAPVWLVISALLIMGLTRAANDIRLTSELQSRLPEDSANNAIGFLTAIEQFVLMAVFYSLGLVFDHFPTGTGFFVGAAAASILAALFWLGRVKLRAAQKKP